MHGRQLDPVRRLVEKAVATALLGVGPAPRSGRRLRSRWRVGRSRASIPISATAGTRSQAGKNTLDPCNFSALVRSKKAG